MQHSIQEQCQRCGVQDPEGVYRTLIECVRNVVEQVNCPIDVIGLEAHGTACCFLTAIVNLWEG